MPPSALGCGPCQMQQVATGDFDGDGRSDVIFADNAGINLYMGTPNTPTPIPIRGTSGLWVVDFNYDASEYWQALDIGQCSIHESGGAVQLGINYVVYAMSH